MRIHHEFSVDQSVDAVWEFFQDIPAVADCLPGAVVEEARGDNVYAGTVSVKLGPITALFEGEAAIAVDADARSARISGQGTDRRGGSRGRVTVDYALAAATAGRTAARIDADVALSGPAAQFGRAGLIDEISKRLIQDFVVCLEAKLRAPTVEESEQVTAPDVNAIGVLFSGLWSWARQLVARRRRTARPSLFARMRGKRNERD